VTTFLILRAVPPALDSPRQAKPACRKAAPPLGGVRRVKGEKSDSWIVTAPESSEPWTFTKRFTLTRHRGAKPRHRVAMHPLRGWVPCQGSG
jgi:hypothetical protein